LVEAPPTNPTLQPAHSVQANFDGKMELQGYDASQSGQELSVTLYWQALTPMNLDYTVFVHLLGPTGETVAQHDGQPTWEVSLPTSTWQPGEILQDKHTLAVPATVSPGQYRLHVGVYYWQTLERLTVLENDSPVNNFVDLGTVPVK
jgi:hypothetical protein